MKTKYIARIAIGLQILALAAGGLVLSVLTGCGRSDNMAREVAREDAEDRKRATEDRNREAALKKEIAASNAKAAREEAQRLKQAEEKEKAEEAESQAGDETNAKAAFKKFESFNLNPQITISEKLKKYNAVADLRGEQIRELQKLHGQKDWIGLMEALGITFGQGEWINKSLPKEPTINRAFSALDSKEYFVTLKTGTPIPMDEVTVPESISHHSGGLHHALFLVAMKKPFHLNPDDAPFEWDTHGWQQHPDNGGFMRKWDIRVDEMFIFLGETPISPFPDGLNTLDVALFKIRTAYEDQAKKLSEKKKLGDIGEAERTKALADLRATLRSQIVALLSKY